MPRLIALGSFEFAPPTVESFHSEQGQPVFGAVVNVHVLSATSAFPATSFTPEEPPLTLAV